MDCLHFTNYFVPLIYNSELLQSALRTRQKLLIGFVKSMARLFYSAQAQKIGFTSSSQTHYSQHKQDDVMQRINIVIPCSLIHTNSTSGNKWKCEYAVGVVIQFLVSWAVVALGVMWMHTMNHPYIASACTQQQDPSPEHECANHDEWYCGPDISGIISPPA